jgi:short-subunit dehydrogenase
MAAIPRWGKVTPVGSFQPSPYFAVYSASKAFVLDFSLALWSGYRGRGIRVLAVCPGPVETAFLDGAAPPGMGFNGDGLACRWGAALPRRPRRPLRC